MSIKYPKGLGKRQMAGAKKLVQEEKKKLLSVKITAEIHSIIPDILNHPYLNNLSPETKILIAVDSMEFVDEAVRCILEIIKGGNQNGKS
jgi:hypothetical protein